MPVKEYFKGSGSKVMSKMKSKYGDEKGKSIFYATANKQDMNPKKGSKKSSKKVSKSASKRMSK